MDKMDLTPHTEEEFLTMVEMHNLYHSHEPEDVQNTRGYSTQKRCRVCRMPLENGRKGLETISRKGNTGVYEHHIAMNGFGTGKGDFNPAWYVAWILKAREFNMFDALLRLSRLDLEKHGVDLRELVTRWFNPVAAMKLGIKPQQYARAAFIYAYRIGKDDDMRKFSSMDPEWAMQYAKHIDKAPHDVTRDGACRYMETALSYAVDIDKGYHPTTLGKVLETEKTSFQYLEAHYNGGKHADMLAIIKGRWVRDSDTALKYAKIVGAEDSTRQLVLDGKIPNKIFEYAQTIDAGPRDDTRKAIIETNDGSWIYAYANMIDKKGRDDTRAASLVSAEAAFKYAQNVDAGPRDDTREAACRSTEYALEYARVIDKGPRDDTRLAASKHSGHALLYARNVDGKPHEVTRKGACHDPGAAANYSIYVDGIPRDDTRFAACASASLAYQYASAHNESHEMTRTLACKDPQQALAYAITIDRVPSNFTREAVQSSPELAARYASWAERYYRDFKGELFEGIEVQKEEAAV